MSWRDTTSATGSQDGSGGSMNASGNVSGTGSGSGEGARGPGGGLRGSGENYKGGISKTALNTAAKKAAATIQKPVIKPVAVPVKPVVPIPVAKPVVPVTTALGPNAGMINTLPQIGGTSPAAIQQAVNFTTQGPTSMPGSPVGPQIGGVEERGITSQYQDTKTGGKMGSGSSQSLGINTSISAPAAPATPNFKAGEGRYGPANPNLPDPRSNVGNIDALGLSNAQLNPFDNVFKKTPLDPSMPGRLAQTSLWDNGVLPIPSPEKKIPDRVTPDDDAPEQISATGSLGTTVYQNPLASPVTLQQAINNAIHRREVSRVKQAYTDDEADGVTRSLGDLNAPDGPLPAGPEGQAPGIVSTNPNVPIPRAKPENIGQVLQAPTTKQIQDRAYPDAPVENAYIDGQIGTILSKNFTPQVNVPENLFDNLTGAPPTRAVLNPKYDKVKDIEVLEPAYRPPSTFAAPPPEVQGQLHEIINRMIDAKRRPESEVGTPSSATEPTTRSIKVNPTAGPPAPAATPPASNALTDLGKLISGKVNEGMATFKDAAEKIEAIGGPEVATGLSKFVQSLSGKGAPTGPGGGERRGGQERQQSGNGKSPRGENGKDARPNPKDWEGKGFTREEIAGLQKLRGEAYTKELARLIALHSSGTPTPDVPGVAPQNQNLLAEYLAKQLEILSRSGNGLISI